jgi:glycosyltransferase involved in cell wall biosynthesis
MKRIKVLHIVYSLQVGGAERVVTNYALHHNRKVYEPVVVALTQGGPLEDDLEAAGVKTYILGKRLGFDPRVIFKLARIMRDEGVKIVHVHTPLANNWGVPAALLSGVKTVIRTEHGLFRRERQFYVFINAVLGLFNRKILACSDRAKDTHVAMDPLSRRKYATIYNGIDVVRYQRVGDTSALRRAIGLPEDAPVVGIIGSLTPLKGHRIFLQMAELISQIRSDVRFLVVGDGPLRAELEALARSNGLADQVIFTGVRRDVPELLSLMDVFVLSSHSEAHPLTILEAMAAGRPVVATDVGGNAESVVHGETGFIVSPNDGQKLFADVKKLLDDPDLARSMGQRGLERVKREFTVQKMVAETEAVYETFHPFRQRVLYVIGQLGVGGAEKQLYYLVRDLDRRRYEPEVVSLSLGGYWAQAMREEGINVIELERKKNVELARLLKLLRVMLRFKPAIVHTYLSSANSYGRIAAALSGVPIRITSERTYILPDSRFIRFMDSELSRFTDAIICNTRANVRFLRKNHRLHSEIMTIYNGIQPLSPNVLERDRLRADFGLGPEDLLVGTIGNLTPPKNHHFLLKVASQLLQRSHLKKRIRFVIIGGGVLEDELRALARSLGIESRVLFAGQLENAVDYLPAFDLFIMTSHYEGLSNAIMEGMLCELPCVVTDVGGNRELVTQGETGYVVRAGDHLAFADRIAELMDDASLRRAMGTRGAKRILNDFSLEQMVGETELKYEELLERKLDL